GGVLDLRGRRVGQRSGHVLCRAGGAHPVVPAGGHQDRMPHLAEPVLQVDPPYSGAAKWRITSGAYRAGPAVRRRYSGSAAPAGGPEVKRPRARQHPGPPVPGPDLPPPPPPQPHPRAPPPPPPPPPPP